MGLGSASLYVAPMTSGGKRSAKAAGGADHAGHNVDAVLRCHRAAARTAKTPPVPSPRNAARATNAWPAGTPGSGCSATTAAITVAPRTTKAALHFEDDE
jgi:hypothetical protein